MTAFNELVDAVASDEAYLQNTLAAAAQHDDFTAKLLGVLTETAAARQQCKSQKVVLGIHRSDYMLDAPSGTFLQVELNTIASSFACLSTLTSQLHNHVLTKLGPGSGLHPERLPSNEAMKGIAAAMAAAVATAGAPDAVMVMVVQPGERNAYDQQVSSI